MALEETQERRGGPLLARRELDPAARALVRPGGLGRLVGDRRRTVVVGVVGDVVAGMMSVRVDDVQGMPLGVVDFCYVEPTSRRQGIGSALLGEVLAFCSLAGCRGIDVPALPGDRVTKQWLEAGGFRARALTMHRPVP